MLHTLLAAVWLLVTVHAVGAGQSMSGLLLAYKQMAARQGLCTFCNGPRFVMLLNMRGKRA